MRTQQTKDGVLMVSQDHISTRVQLNQDVIRVLALTELQVNHTIHS